MADVSWYLKGDCLEVCNCDFLCLCIPTNRTAVPTQGECITVLSFDIQEGAFGDLTLSGLGLALVLHTPGPMADGDWSVGVIVDENATTEQKDCLVAIARGEVGGPLEPMRALTTNFLGVETGSIEFGKDGLQRSIRIPDRVHQEVSGAPSPVKPGEPMYLDNTGHRANPRIAIARTSTNQIHAFGLNWGDDSGSNSGAYTPFEWKIG